MTMPLLHALPTSGYEKDDRLSGGIPSDWCSGKNRFYSDVVRPTVQFLSSTVGNKTKKKLGHKPVKISMPAAFVSRSVFLSVKTLQNLITDCFPAPPKFFRPFLCFAAEISTPWQHCSQSDIYFFIQIAHGKLRSSSVESHRFLIACCSGYAVLNFPGSNPIVHFIPSHRFSHTVPYIFNGSLAKCWNFAHWY
jgi:hypothetical protein